MRLLEGENVSKNFGGVVALNGVNFHVDKGEIVGLIGPNGAGKTTLFNLISSVYPLDKGTIKFRGEKVTGLKPHQVCKRGISRTFQVTMSFANISAIENVMIGALFGKGSMKSLRAAREKAKSTMEFVGLMGKADIPAGSLISGDARKLELARALAASPDILLLDEVMAGLNPSEVSEAMERIRTLRSEMGITIFMVEHIMKSVMGISDRVIVLDSGRQIAEGSPKEVIANPRVIEAYLGETTEF
jgi:branched-chain amino acid transport system ATP-binding protein